MVEMKVCNKCGNIAGYNSWFGAVMCPSCNYIEKESSFICDICKERRESDKFIIPNYVYYYAMKNGIKMSKIKFLERSEVFICSECQKSIAKLIDTLKKNL